MTHAEVLYIANSAEIGGGNRSLLTLWAGLSVHRVTPIAVCPSEGPMVRACHDLGIPCRILADSGPDWRRPGITWSRFHWWRRLLDEYGVSLVHANGSSGARAVGWAAWSMGVPLVCHCRFPEKRTFVEWNYRLVKKPDVVVFNSESLSSEMAEIYRDSCPATRQVVVHNAVDLDGFHPQPKPSAVPLRVGIVANLVRVKGHEDFLNMARDLIGRGWDAVEFWIIGGEREAGYSNELKQLASFDSSGRVQFLGFRDDIPDLLAQLDILVCSSHVEPFGRCLIEAMATVLPVVATSVGGIPEVVTNGETGFLVPPGEPQSLADAVERLLGDEALRRQMGAAGRKRAEAYFSKESHADRIFEIYRSVLSVRRQAFGR